jgi:hypothetical protein
MSMGSNEDAPRIRPDHAEGERTFGGFGLTPFGVGDGPSMSNAEESIRTVSELLKSPVRHVDEIGYEHEITAGAVHPAIKAIASVHRKSKTLERGFVDIEFRLKAQVDGRSVIDWVVETYNPYFGCDVRYMAWHDRWIVMIYREKHHTYACSHSSTGESQLVQLRDEWLVTDNQIICRSMEPDFVDRFGLPDLHGVPPISAEVARQEGVLPPDYDRWNEWHKNHEWERRQSSKPMLSEPEWFSSLQPEAMLAFLRNKASDRKLRLLGVACCRQIWGEFRDERSRRSVEIAEDFAEGRCDKQRLSLARQKALTVAGAAYRVMDDIPRIAVNLDVLRAAYIAARAADAAQQVAAEDAFQATSAAAQTMSLVASSRESSTGKQAIQVALLRDIFGNPFRPSFLNPAWATSTVLNLADTIYETLAFDRLPIVADALEESGCTSREILNHCRQPGEHVRGCWVVDLLLGKQ